MTLLQKYGQKLLVSMLWFIILGSYWQYTMQNNLSPLATTQYLSDFLISSPYGPLLFVAIYLIRPLVLFPMSILTLLAGFLFGPIEGFVCTLSGAVISGMMAYVIGFYFGSDVLVSKKKQGLVERYIDQLRRDGFEAVLVMRLILLNYDFVSYLAGFLRVNWKAFLGATLLGSVAGTAAYVLAGASIEGAFTGELPDFNFWMLSVAVILFGVSFVVAWYTRQRQIGMKTGSSR